VTHLHRAEDILGMRVEVLVDPNAERVSEVTLLEALRAWRLSRGASLKHQHVCHDARSCGLVVGARWQAHGAEQVT
jgi:hypothetical protein